jgi:hypothetical protein
MKKPKKEKEYACCSEETMTCDACKFEDSIKVEDKENE